MMMKGQQKRDTQNSYVIIDKWRKQGESRDKGKCKGNGEVKCKFILVYVMMGYGDNGGITPFLGTILPLTETGYISRFWQTFNLASSTIALFYLVQFLYSTGTYIYIYCLITHRSNQMHYFYCLKLKTIYNISL
jgi:hypothetical protein